MRLPAPPRGGSAWCLTAYLGTSCVGDWVLVLGREDPEEQRGGEDPTRARRACLSIS